MEPTTNTENEVADAKEKTAEQSERRERAQAIVELGSYSRMLEAFGEEPGLLEEMTADLKQREAFLITEAPYLSESDWKILTCLELFDRATFEHCERTWALAREKLESTAEVGAHFRDRLAKEGLAVETVLRACLLHDCGKMCIDKQILNDTHTDAEWKLAGEKFCMHAYGVDRGAEAVAELDAYLEEHPGHRAIHKVPFEAIAELDEKGRQTLEELKAKGVDVSLPLATLLERHPEYSKETLTVGWDADPAITLVANHHPKRPITEEEYPTGLSVVRSGMTLSTEMSLALDIVRLSDIFDAMHSARVYKPGHPNFFALEYLMREADRGHIDFADAEEWVKDTMSHLDEQEYFAHFVEYVEQERVTSSYTKLAELEKLLEEEKLAREKLRARGLIPS